MRARLRNGTVVSFLPGSVLIRLPGGKIVRSRPQKTGAYRATADRLGYGSNTLAMCRDHDPLHAILCDWLGLADSFALRSAAGIDAENEISGAEEAAVLAVQRFMRLLARNCRGVLYKIMAQNVAPRALCYKNRYRKWLDA